jgi:adenylate cyclase
VAQANVDQPDSSDTPIVEYSGLLDGLRGDSRRDRAELIAWLRDRGFTTDQIRASLAPMLLPSNRIMGDDGVRVSARQTAQETGVDVQLIEQLQRAIGLPRIDDPDAAVLPHADAEAAAHTAFFVDLGMEVEEVVAVVRVLMEGLGRATAMMRGPAFKVMSRPGVSEVELARHAEALATRAAPRIGPMIERLFLMQLRYMFEAEGISAAERATGALPGARQVAVAFADLAGFTQLGEALPPEDLARVVGRLAELTREVVTTPVWFIKTIGDAVMLVSTDPGALVTTVLELVDVVAASRLPELRAGVAAGSAVNRGGDWFGSPVNTAHRVTAIARSGTVLVADSVRERVGATSGLVWSSAGARQLRGISQPVSLYSVSRTY